MAYPFEKPFYDAVTRLDALKYQLALLDVVRPHGTHKDKDVSAAHRASIYVWLAAILEAYVRECLLALIGHLGTQGIRKRDLQLSLFALVEGKRFDTLKDVRGLKQWEARVEVLRSSGEGTVAGFPSSILPLDGRTLEPRHLEVIWAVFGFPGPSLPSPRHKLALIDLSEWRNRLAHGAAEPQAVGRMKTSKDLQRLVGSVEDIVEHLHFAAASYCDDGKFRR